ncbi:hypothetical protein BGZ74_005420 [Mortierella antarctica]|nr:hypothetical protein BGZ74_005420 [Mortierella antarctica]
MITFHHSTHLPRLIVTDLDGTLLNPERTVTTRSVQTLHLAQSFRLQHNSRSSDSDETAQTAASAHAPIRIMLASGRSARSIQRVIDENFQGIMVPDAVLCSNGALTYNPRTKTISFPQFIPLDEAIKTVDRLTMAIKSESVSKHQLPIEKRADIDHDLDDNEMIKGRPGFACQVLWFSLEQDGSISYGADTFFVCDRTFETERRGGIHYDYLAVDDMQEFLRSLHEPLAGTENGANKIPRGGIIKLLALDRNRVASEVYESLPDSLRSKAGSSDAPTAIPPISLTYSGPLFLEVSGPGVNKGLGLRQYCDGNGIARQDVAAFGDLLNDAEMLEYAGLGLCMGNGHPEMKRLADRVIGTNAEDGLAKEIESWFSTNPKYSAD